MNAAKSKERIETLLKALEDAILIAKVNNGEIDFTTMTKQELSEYGAAYSRWENIKVLAISLREELGEEVGL